MSCWTLFSANLESCRQEMARLLDELKKATFIALVVLVRHTVDSVSLPKPRTTHTDTHLMLLSN